TWDGVPVLQDVPVAQYLFSNKRTNDIQRSVLILITPRAAGDVQPDPGQSAAMTSSMRALREQFGISVGSTPNVQAVFNSLKANALFREFRQGDVSMDRWDHVRTTGERLRQALDFLYY
ncbi:MAG: pilus assembly protein CpaC, partial [Candidatus Paceibacteria bacterium]